MRDFAGLNNERQIHLGRENRDIEREKSSSKGSLRKRRGMPLEIGGARREKRGRGIKMAKGERKRERKGVGREETRVGGGTGCGIKMRVVTDGGRIFHLIPRSWKNCICPRQPLGFE